MTTLIFNKKELEKYIKLSEGIEEKISLLGIPCKISEEQVEIEVLPNRPDLLSLQGFVRAVNAFLGKEPAPKKYSVHKGEKDFKVFIKDSVKNVRPYTACAIVKNISFTDETIRSLVEMQEKIHATFGRNRKKLAIGIYPLEKIKLPIRYEARKPEQIKFRPLESDCEMTAQEILAKHPTGQEYASLLNNYDNYPIFIDSANNILSMPPIINSYETGKVTEKTKEVFIECSGWHFETLSKALNIVVTALADMGGKIYSMEIIEKRKTIAKTPSLANFKVRISLDNVNSLLGIFLKEKDLEKLLPKMGCLYKKGFAYVPAWRADVLHEVDIIEDIAIAYGYENFKPELPEIASIGKEEAMPKFKNQLRELLIGLGLVEISSYHLIKEEESEKIKKTEKIEVKNSKTEYKLLRPNLMIPALRVFAENKNNEYPQKLFEIGAIFKIDKIKNKEVGITESEHLIVAISPGNLTNIQQIIGYLFRLIGAEYHIEPAALPGLIEGRTGSILHNKKEIGHIGEMHPETLAAYNIKMPVAIAEVSVVELLKNKSS